MGLHIQGFEITDGNSAGNGNEHESFLHGRSLSQQWMDISISNFLCVCWGISQMLWRNYKQNKYLEGEDTGQQILAPKVYTAVSDASEGDYVLVM